MKILYNYTGNDLREFKRGYSELVQREYWRGDVELEASNQLDVTVRQSIGYPIAIFKIVANSGISFRRSWHHIREERSGNLALWFVNRGSMRAAGSSMTVTAQSGECLIKSSGQPLHMRASLDGAGLWDAVGVVVPQHLFLPHLPDAASLDAHTSVAVADRRAVGQLLELLLEEGPNLSRRAIEPLTTAFLEMVGESMRPSEGRSTKRLADRRFADIESDISMNLTDPNLCCESVARRCGISSRYLNHILSANQTTFSAMLWTRRLTVAHQRLASEASRDCSIQEIALRAGFKSAAHFSRMFKRTYSCTPKEHRERCAFYEGVSFGMD